MFIDDAEGILSAQDTHAIEQATSRFDVKVLVTSKASKAELDARVGHMVNSGNTLAIGVDPVHRYTFTHFGIGLGISSSDFQTVARSGNQEFKQGHWAQGITGIIGTTNGYAAKAERVQVAARQTIVVPTQTTVVEHPVPAWPFILGVLVLGLFGYLAWRLVRRKQQDVDATIDDFRDEAQTMRTRNLEEQSWHDKAAAAQANNANNAENARMAPGKAAAIVAPPDPALIGNRFRPAQPYVPPPSYQPPVVVHQSGGSGDLLTGVLIGNMLSDRRTIAAPDEPPRHHARPSSDDDAGSGGGGFSWDSSSSDSSGSGGGGFDSGGGGFDSGGGGGDF
jgi:uncharacterized membrane protein YgcG